jgi:hypothetical protein
MTQSDRPAGRFAPVTSPARITGRVVLTDEQAHQVWNWTLTRQGLHPDTRLASTAEITHAALGVHTARLPSPYATVLARAKDPQIALDVLGPQPGMTTLRCMRKTLYLLPLDLAGAAHAATAHYRLRDAARLAHNAGISTAVLTTTRTELVRLLEDGPRHHRDLERLLAAQGHTVPAVRLALKTAWENGTLTYLNQSGCWNAEHRAFALTAGVHPGLDTALDRRDATRALVAAYFDRYGPATIKDVMWWSALSRTAVITAMDDTGTDWVQAATPWADAPAYLPAQWWEEFQASPEQARRTGLNLLAHEDVALKAYFETRARYLADLPATTAFNQIGEVLPTVLVDGHIHGTWAWNPHTLTASTTLARTGTTAALGRATAELTEALRAGWRDRTLPLDDPDQLALPI